MDRAECQRPSVLPGVPGVGSRGRIHREGGCAAILGGGGQPRAHRAKEERLKVRQATEGDLPALVALFLELDLMQRDWRVFTPRPGFYDEVGVKYRDAMESEDRLVVVAEEDG